MTNDHELSQLVLQAVRDPVCWKKICDLLAERFAARNVVLTVYKKPDTAVFTATCGNSANLVDAYWKNERAGDVWLDRIADLTAGTVTRGSDLLPDSEFRQTCFYKSYLAPLKIGRLLTGILINDDDYRAFVGVMRAPDEDDFNLEDQSRLKALLPVLQLAVVSYLEIRQQKMWNGYVADGWLSVNNVGAVILGPDNEVIYTNAFARAYIAEDPALEVKSGQLIFLGESESYQRVQSNIWLASQPEQAGASKIRFQTLVKGDKIFQWLFVNIRQFSDYVDYGLEQEDSCMVLIQALDQTTSYLDEERLSAYWSLTKAEIRVVRGICDGMKINEISKENDVSVHTVRAQVKSVYEKMGVNSQSGLLRLVAEDSLVALPSFTNLDTNNRGITYEVI